ncbi:Translation termination inhibitor protein ITT1 [Spathaspora sp. JA1]|nr:Translation termination inhibitor protein ITT1 [Spathaspora sp. JA1]
MSEDIIQELQACQSIYPNLSYDETSLSGSIEIPLKLDSETDISLCSTNNHLVTSSSIVNLPPIHFRFTLPETYPHDAPPIINLKSDIISSNKLTQLSDKLNSIWIEYKDQIIFILIDTLLETTQYKLSQLIETPIRTDNAQLYSEILEYDKLIKLQEFNNQTFNCQICQMNNLGLNCQMFNCNHIFCNSCLSEYFKSVIISSEVDKVHCPDFECTKKHIKTKESMNHMGIGDVNVREIVNALLTPPVPLSMLTSIFNSTTTPTDKEKSDTDTHADTPTLVNRYFKLYQKSQFELIGQLLPNRLVQCPRLGCDQVIFRQDLQTRLVQCDKCQYAFCNDCKMSYHTRFKLCNKLTHTQSYSGIPVSDLQTYPQLSSDSYERKTLNAKYGRLVILRAVDEYNMDQLFQQMLSEGSSSIKQCPGCDTVIEKSQGCNRMKCNQCSTCFCFNCGERIDVTYDHFSDPSSPCYKLLFLGMEGTD